RRWRGEPYHHQSRHLRRGAGWPEADRNRARRDARGTARPDRRTVRGISRFAQTPAPIVGSGRFFFAGTGVPVATRQASFAPLVTSPDAHEASRMRKASPAVLDVSGGFSEMSEDGQSKSKQTLVLIGGRYRFRTCDPYHVKVVLYR